MRVASLTGVGELEVREQDRPEPGPNEVLLRVEDIYEEENEERRKIEEGNHDALMAQGGLYADLHEKQLLEQEIEAIG